MSKGFRVTVEDLDTGDKQSKVIGEGDYILIPFGDCSLSTSQRYSNGTVQLTLKDHHPQPVDAPDQSDTEG